MTGLVMTGPRVFTSRVTTYDRASELPCLNIIITEETFDRGEESGQMGDEQQIRRITIDIEGRVAADGANIIDDDLDELALQVENRFNTDWTLTNRLWDNEYTGTTLGFDDEAESETGLVVISYAGAYMIAADNPEIII
jgi:hypothetical protein